MILQSNNIIKKKRKMYYYPVFCPQISGGPDSLNSRFYQISSYPLTFQVQIQSPSVIYNQVMIPSQNQQFIDEANRQIQASPPLNFICFNKKSQILPGHREASQEKSDKCEQNEKSEQNLSKLSQKRKGKLKSLSKSKYCDQEKSQLFQEFLQAPKCIPKSRIPVKQKEPENKKLLNYTNSVIYEKNQKQISFQFESQNIQQDPSNIPYPKKNTQSNIVNQIFSFVSTESKSSHILEQYLGGNSKKIKSFYQILKSIKKRKKKYINRKYISSLCTLKENDVGYKMLLRTKNKINVLTIQQFQKILSVLIFYYLRKEAEVNIITSKKINKSTFIEHLERRREISKFIVSNLRTQQSQASQAQSKEIEKNISGESANL